MSSRINCGMAKSLAHDLGPRVGGEAIPQLLNQVDNRIIYLVLH